MTNFRTLNKNDQAIVRSAGLKAADVNNAAAIGFNALGGGVNGKGVTLFHSVYDARVFLRDAPVSRDIIVF